MITNHLSINKRPNIQHPKLSLKNNNNKKQRNKTAPKKAKQPEAVSYLLKLEVLFRGSRRGGGLKTKTPNQKVSVNLIHIRQHARNSHHW